MKSLYSATGWQIVAGYRYSCREVYSAAQKKTHINCFNSMLQWSYTYTPQQAVVKLFICDTSRKRVCLPSKQKLCFSPTGLLEWGFNSQFHSNCQQPLITSWRITFCPRSPTSLYGCVNESLFYDLNEPFSDLFLMCL